MKTQALLILFLFISTFQCLAHDKITFKNKEAFNSSCEKGKSCSTFDLISLTDEASLKQANEFIQNNAAIMEASTKGTMMHLTMLADKVEKVIYQKLFYQLGLHEIEILEGDSKGIYSIDEFLNLYL